jgi:hypothetical protein
MLPKPIACAALFLFLLSCGDLPSRAQQPTAAPQPAQPALNASVSDFGTTFIFSPPPICAKCIETELGFLSLEDGRYIPVVLSFAPFSSSTDINVLVNALDSEAPGNRRTTHFGNRFDFVIRQQAYTKGGFELTLGPRGTIFDRDGDGGRIGAVAAPQYSKGNNLYAANFTLTAGIDLSAANPRTDYVGSFDYYRTLSPKGYQLFLGFNHELAAGQQTVGTEEGLVIPFRNGQVELSTQQLTLNTDPEWQAQARVIVNWGKLLARK